MRALSPVAALWRTEIVLRWWRWALCELTLTNPMHPDMTKIILRIRALEAVK